MPVYKHKKTGKWYWRIRRNGLDLTSPKYFIRKDDCEREERLAQLEVDNGSYNPNSKKAHKVSYEMLSDQYEKLVLAKKPKSKQEHIVKFWKERFGKRTLSTISTVDIDEARLYLEKTPMRKQSPTSATKYREVSTVNKYITVLHHIFEKAKKWNYTAVNPVDLEDLPKVHDAREVQFTDEERNALLQAAKEYQNPLLYGIFLCALDGGLRTSEIKNIQWGDISFDRNEILVTDRKNKRNLILPISSRLRDELLRLWECRNQITPLVFPGRKPLKPYDFTKGWHNVFKKTGLLEKGMRFHDTRHDFGYRLVKAGVHPYVSQELLGHVDPRQTRRYSSVDDKMKREAIDGLS